jgi:hypothetical protein
MESVENAHGRPRLGSAASLRMPLLLPMSGRSVAECLEFRLESRQLLVGHVLHVDEGVAGSRDRPMSSSHLSCVMRASRFCVFWIRNTMRNVTTVVPVLMTNCHVF